MKRNFGRNFELRRGQNKEELPLWNTLFGSIILDSCNKIEGDCLLYTLKILY